MACVRCFLTVTISYFSIVGTKVGQNGRTTKGRKKAAVPRTREIFQTNAFFVAILLTHRTIHDGATVLSALGKALVSLLPPSLAIYGQTMHSFITVSSSISLTDLAIDLCFRHIERSRGGYPEACKAHFLLMGGHNSASKNTSRASSSGTLRKISGICHFGGKNENIDF